MAHLIQLNINFLHQDIATQLQIETAIIEKRTKRCKLCSVDYVKRAIRNSILDRPFMDIEMGKKTDFDFDTASVTFLNTSKLGISQVAWLK